MEAAVFIIFAVLAVAFAIVVVAHPHPVKSTMSMVVVLFCLAVLFTLLGAPMIAALQVLVYTGAILVLFLFVIMLLNIGRERAPVVDRPAQRWVALIAAAFFAGFLGMLLWRTHTVDTLSALTPDYLSIHRLSWELFTTWILPFELVGLLLLVAVVAAYVLARAPRPGEMAPAAEPAASENAQAATAPAHAEAGSHP
jgi:NADH-quinone oxidoreductase subunit J